MNKTHDFSMELSFTDAYRRTAGQHIALREAACLRAEFPAALTEIEDGDLLAGRVRWGLVGFTPHNGPTDCGYGYYCHEFKIIEAIENGNIPLHQRDGVMEMLHFWKRETSQNKVEAVFTEKMLPVLFREELASLPFNFKPMIAQPLYRMAGVFLDYQKLMSLGLPGLAAEVTAYRDKAKAAGGDHELYQGMLGAIEVVAGSCRFYREQAIEKAGTATDPTRSERSASWPALWTPSASPSRARSTRPCS